MPPRPPSASILALEADRQVRELWRSLAPERWPVPPGAFPADAVLVGGAVRDGLLGRLPEQPDLDIVVDGDAIALAGDLARTRAGTCVVLDRQRCMARLVVGGWTFDLARRIGGSLEADLARRDFTVNAMALRWPSAEVEGAGGLIDLHGGLEDLSCGRVTALAESNLLEDPLRLMRGIRLACELGFGITPETWRWIRLHRARIADVAGERVLAELERMAAAPGGHRGLHQVVEVGLVEPWQGGEDPLERDLTLQTLRLLSQERARSLGLNPGEMAQALPMARLAAVLDEGAVKRLSGSRLLRQRCRRLRRWWARLRRGCGATLRSLDSLEEDGRLDLQIELEPDLPALLLLLEDRPQAVTALRRWRNPDDPLFHPRPPLDGHTLQKRLGLGPGPEVGRLLRFLTRERAFDRLSGDGTPSPLLLEQAAQWIHREGVRHG